VHVLCVRVCWFVGVWGCFCVGVVGGMWCVCVCVFWRPKNGWEDDIRNYMKKLKLKNCTSCIQDRSRWKLYVERAKTFKG
jgi:hypothetical protein